MAFDVGQWMFLRLCRLLTDYLGALNWMVFEVPDGFP